MTEDTTRFDAFDLRKIVDDLTLPVMVKVTQDINGTTYTRRLPQDPLLTQLAAAVHGSMRSGSGASSNLPGTAIPLDGDALYQFTIISSQITDWCRIAGADRHRHPVDGLRAWHAATLTDRDIDRSVEVGILRAWAGVIRGRLNPPRTLELTLPCPECDATRWADDDGDAGPHPLIVTYRPDDQDVFRTARARCRACGFEWVGITALRSLAFDLEGVTA